MPKTGTLDLETLVLLHGSHHDRNEGVCAMEAVAWLAGERHTDHPACTSPVLASYVRSLNDTLDDAGRQRLKPFLPRLLNTAGDPAADETRGWLAADWMVHVYAPTWLKAAGLDEQAAVVAALPRVVDATTLRDAVAAIDPLGTELWKRRAEAFERLRAEFKVAFEAELAKHPKAALAARDLAARAARAALADLADLAARALARRQDTRNESRRGVRRAATRRSLSAPADT